MKPRRKNDQGRGLARWGWIKSYLGPTLKYIGITSGEFDKIISGGDQHIEQGSESENDSGIAVRFISINNNLYPILGDIPTEDGYICVVFDFEPGVTEIDPFSIPPAYISSGTITLLTQPRWFLTNILNLRASVDTDGAVTSNGKAVIPVAFRSGQALEVYIRSGQITFTTFGTLGIDAFLS